MTLFRDQSQQVLQSYGEIDYSVMDVSTYWSQGTRSVFSIMLKGTVSHWWLGIVFSSDVRFFATRPFVQHMRKHTQTQVRGVDSWIHKFSSSRCTGISIPFSIVSGSQNKSIYKMIYSVCETPSSYSCYFQISTSFTVVLQIPFSVVSLNHISSPHSQDFDALVVTRTLYT
jgi:hypothetical protein